MGKLKSGFALAVLCMVALGIAACGGGSDSGSSSSTGASGGDSAKLSGTVEVWDFEYETIPRWTEVMDALDQEFEKLNPGVKVERVAQPYENWEAVYRAAFTAREGPDAMLFQPGASGLLSFKDGLEPLNDRISPDLKEHLNQWESVTPNLTPDGEIYGIPYTTQAWVFYYNKELFKKAGLPTDFEPKTWAEVREAGEKLKAAGIQPFTGGNKEG
jgi:ABC-type glycerol-3-phosphate transport system substrate-binding protein